MNLYLASNRGETDPVYQKLAASNSTRQIDFLHSVIEAAVESRRPWLSEELIKALNFHAIVALHSEAGQYRSSPVSVLDPDGNVQYEAPPHYLVPPLMSDLVHNVNWLWEQAESTVLAAIALWRINAIHPFVNGNGRTARAVCYFIMCVKAGSLLPGRTTIPQILRGPKYDEYVAALKAADQSDLAPLVALVREAVNMQLGSTAP